MVRHSQAGRPPQAGPRDASGRLIRGDGRADQIWHRIKADAVALGLDARAGTWLSRLAMRGDLTDLQVQAGFLVGRYYADAERWCGVRSGPTHPGYVRWIKPETVDAEDDDDRDDDETVEALDEREERLTKKARERLDRLRKCIASVLPSPEAAARATTALVTLCCDDQPIASAILPDVAWLLGHIAHHFSLSSDKPVHSIAITANRPRRRGGVDPRRGQGDRSAFIKVQRMLRPELSEEELETAWRTFRALSEVPRAKRDRERYRTDKRRRA